MAPILPNAMDITVSEGVSFYTRVYGGSAEVYNIMPPRVPYRKNIDSKLFISRIYRVDRVSHNISKKVFTQHSGVDLKSIVGKCQPHADAVGMATKRPSSHL